MRSVEGEQRNRGRLFLRLGLFQAGDAVAFLEFAAFAEQLHALITGEHSALGFSGTTDFQAGML